MTQSLENYRFTQTHEWIRIEGKAATVGISDHAQKEVTDVVYVEVPAAGKTVKAGEEVTTLESVKAAFSLYAPSGGKITQGNEALKQDPGLINRSPHEEGWIWKMELSNPAEVSRLMTLAQYEEFVKSGAHA